MTYDDEVWKRREQFELEHEAQQARIRRESSLTFGRAELHQGANYAGDLYIADTGALAIAQLRVEDAERNATERASRWLARRVCGQSFRSESALVDFACRQAVSQLDRALSGAEYRRIVRVAGALWLAGLGVPSARVA